MADRDWAAIASEYIEGKDGLRTLAERHGIPAGTLFDRARRELWAMQRRERHAERRREAAESAESPFGSGRPAAGETITLFEGGRPAAPEAKTLREGGRPAAGETITLFEGGRPAALEKDEERIFRVTDKLVRRAEELLDCGEIGARELGELMRAIKNAKEIKMLRSALDEREQQARVRALEEKNEPAKHETLRIEFSAEAEEAAQ